MTSRFTKYGIAIIAAVLLIGVCAGAASADVKIIDSLSAYTSNFSGTSIPAGTTYYIYNDGSWKIPALHKDTDQLSISGSGKVVMDFTNVTDYGCYAGVSATTKQIGGLFGNVKPNGQTLEIVGLNMTSVVIVSSGWIVGGVIGLVDGGGTLNFTNCHLVNCSINGTSSNSESVGGLVGQALDPSLYVNFEDCKVQYCDVVAGRSNVGGLIGNANNVNFLRCNVLNSTIAIHGNKDRVGGLAGNAGYGSVGTGRINTCSVENSSIYAYGREVGGLVGFSGLIAANSLFIEGSKVTNCVIASGNSIMGYSNMVGGLVGQGRYNLNLTNNLVKGCTIRSNNGEEAGGLVGFIDLTLTPVVISGTNNDVVDSAVSGDSLFGAQCGGIAGSGSGSVPTIGATPVGITYYKSDGTTAITLPDANFWKLVSYGKANQTSPDTVYTKLGTYGEPGGYGAGSAPKYTVGIGDVQGGTLTPSSSSDIVGMLISVTGTPNPGYYAVNWTHYNNSDVSGSPKIPFTRTFLLPGYNVTVGGDFKENVTNATFYNLSVPIESKLNTYNNPTNATPTAPTRIGYQFYNWNVSTGPSTWASFDSDSYNKSGIWNYTGEHDGTLSVYANWTPHTYNVTFHSNNGTDVTLKQMFTYDVAQTLAPNTFIYPGYTFVNWSTTAAGTGTNYTDGESVRNLTETQGANIDLHARWKPNETTVTFHTDAGTEDKLNTFAQPVNFSTTPTKTGYVFTMWNVSSSGKDLNSNTYVKSGNWNYTGTESVLHAYANWTLPPYVEVSDWDQLVANVSVWTDTANMRTVVLTNTTNGAYKNATGTAGQYDGIPVTGNITIKPALNIGEIKIDGNGMGCIFYVETDGSLILAGNGTGGIDVTGGNHTVSSGGAIYVSSGANLTLSENVRITNSTSSFNGGAVAVGGGTFTMNKASISGCHVGSCGGGVSVSTDGNFTMIDSVIEDCWCVNTQVGGGIHANVNSLFTMTGGRITNCTAYGGGGLYTYGTGTLTDATISGNTGSIGSGIISFINSITLNGNTQITNNDFALMYSLGYYPSIICSSSFAGSVANITLYDGTPAENLSIWTAQPVVRNGAALKNRFALSSQYAGYKLTERGSDLILGIDVPTNTIYAMILNASGNPVNVTLNSSSGTHIATKPLAAGETNATFTGLADGAYSLFGYLETATGNAGVSKLVSLKGGEGVYVELLFPQMNVTSAVNTDAEPGAPAPKVTVDGLDQIAAAEPSSPGAGKEIVISFNAKGEVYNATNANQTALKNNITASAPNAEIRYLNFTVKRSIVDIATNTTDSETVISDPAALMTIYLEYDMNGRENLQVWRVHNGNVDEFQELAAGTTPGDGNYTRDGTKGVYIYSKHFSSYALSSSAIPSAPSSGGSSSKNYGGSMWAQNPYDVPTVAPTVAPTAAPVYDTPTAAPTAQQTQKSPAPVAGLIAGLGVAALGLARLRK